MSLLSVFLSTIIFITSRTASGGDTISCDTFNPNKIKLVTFDVFAALMNLDGLS